MFLDNFIEKLRPSKNENTAIAGIGCPVGPSTIFITQYGSMSKEEPDKRKVDGYAFSNDILPKNLFVRDENSKIAVKESEEFLKDKYFSIFKYVGEDADVIKSKVFAAYKEGTLIDRSFFYEVTSHKDLIADRQIYSDPVFKELDLETITAKRLADIQSIIDGYKQSKGSFMSKGLPIMSDKELGIAKVLTGGDERIQIMESVLGFYAVDSTTGKRTACYQNITDIPIKVFKGGEFL